MAVPTMNPPEVEPRQRLTKWEDGAAPLVTPTPQTEEVA